MTNCKPCNGFGWVYVRGEDVYSTKGYPQPGFTTGVCPKCHGTGRIEDDKSKPATV